MLNKNNVKNSLLLFLANALMLGCQDRPDPTKNETTIVNGIVLEYGTKKPIAGAVVKMVDREAGRDTVAKAVTDANGKFSYSYKGPISFGLCSYVYKDQYFTEQGSYSPENPDMCHQWGVENNPALTAKPYAWLKLRLINTSGATGFSINRPVGAEKGLQMGFVADTTVYFLVWGNYNDSLGTFIHNGSSVTPNPFPFYATGHDTTLYEIKY